MANDKETLPAEITPEAQKLMEQPVTMIEYADSLVINDNSDYSKGAETLRRMKTKQKELDDTRKGITAPMDKAKKRIMDLFRKPLDQIASAEKTIKGKMIAYDAKVEAKRREEEAKAQERARKEQEKLQKRADKAREKGQEEKAEDLETKVDEVNVPVVATQKAEATGVHTTTTWNAEVISKMDLIKAVAAGTAPEALLDVNMPTANKMAKALKDSMAYPGLKAVSKKSVSARAA